MKIFLNGEIVQCDDASTIAQLVERHQLPPGATLVEHNGRALHRRDWAYRRLQENDRVEILSVAAGG